MDFSLTTLFVVPVGQTTLPSSGSTQDLTAGQVGLFKSNYAPALVGDIAAAPYFYVAQGRANTFMQGSKRSNKIKGCLAGTPCNSNVTEWYKVNGCANPANQIVDVDGWNVKCGDIVTLTLRAHSSYIDTLYNNGLTRSVTVQAPCCECGGDPCDTVDVPALIDAFIVKLEQHTEGINPDNIMLTQFFNFERIGSGDTAILRISGKALTAYGVPCDVSAFPYEYDRMWFRTFVYSGPATSVDFIVADSCNIVAEATVTQTSTYISGSAAEIAQMEKNYYSYQAGYAKHLFTKMGYNQNFESYVAAGQTYDTYYIKFNDLDKSADNWGSNLAEDSTVVIACIANGAFATALETVLEAALGTVVSDNVCVTTTSTTTVAPTTTTTSTTAAVTTTTTTTAG